MISLHWTRENIAWLSGLFEGEGCTYIIRPGIVNLVINMTDLDVIEKARLISGCGNITGPINSKYKNHKPQWRWKVSNSEHCYALIAALYPFMGERRSAKMLEFINQYKNIGPYITRIHGTRARYKNLGCRCNACISASREYGRMRGGLATTRE